MNMTICPNGHYYDLDRNLFCPYCQKSGLSESPEEVFPKPGENYLEFVYPLPEGTVLGGRYLIESGEDGFGQIRYTARDIRRDRRVFIREFAERVFRDKDGTLNGPPLPTDFADNFLAKFPQAVDSFLQNGTVYAVLEEDNEPLPQPPLPIILPEPEPEEPYVPETVRIEPLTVPEPVFFMPDLDPDLPAAEPRPAPARRMRIADPELICRKCLHVSATPFNRCAVCGEWADPRPSARARRDALPLRTFLAGKFLVEDLLFSDEEHHVYAGWDMYESRPVELIEYFPTYLARRSSDGYTLELFDEDGSSVEDRFSRGFTRFVSCFGLYARYGGSPGVPELAGAFYENATAYIAAYIEEGRTLSDIIPPEGMEPGTLLAILRDIAEGTKALHLKGGAHAGISANSIFVTASGRALLLTPFGSTRPPADLTASRLYGYMYAPLAELQMLTPACDVWSLAVTALAALSGKGDAPFSPEDSKPDLSGVKDLNAKTLLLTVLSDLDTRPRTPEDFVRALYSCFITEETGG